MPFPSSEEPRTPSSATPLQTGATVVAAAAAVISVIAQSKDRPLLAWSLVCVALLVTVVNFYQPLANHLRARKRQATRDKTACSYYPELLRFAKRFGRFADPGVADNLRNILFDLCGNNQVELSKLCPPDYVRDFFPLFIARHENRPTKDVADFTFAIWELCQFVRSYNSDYIQEPFRRIRGSQWLATFPEARQQQAERQIEDFRERWVSFLDDFQQLLERLRDSLGGGVLPTYFERPQRL